MKTELIKKHCQACQFSCPFTGQDHLRSHCLHIPLSLTVPAWVISDIEMTVMEPVNGNLALNVFTENNLS